MSKCLPLAMFLLLLGGCSKTVSMAPMPPPPANLAQKCRSLPPVPNPLLDPERLQWEVDLIDAYEDCAVRHRLTIEAWEGAVQEADK